MAKGYCISIGLNSVDDDYYDWGGAGALNAPEKDATDIANIAVELGYEKVSLFLGKNATKQKVVDGIQNAAAVLNNGDILLIYFSGHGMQVPDYNGDEREYDPLDDVDEAWCLYDNFILDDDIMNLMTTFKSGVRIFAISDSCFSGGIFGFMANNQRFIRQSAWTSALFLRTIEKTRIKKTIKLALRQSTYQVNSRTFSFTNGIETTTVPANPLNASIVFLSACQADKTSKDGDNSEENSVFTKALLEVWNLGSFNSNYSDFYAEIVTKLIPSFQTPEFRVLGPIDPKFIHDKPFTI